MDIGARAAGLFVAGDSNPGTITVAPGGVGRNIAHNLALLGDTVRLVTVFGDDGFGRMLRESCAATGMDLSLSQTVSGARNACFVSVNGSDGELFGGVSDMAITGSAVVYACLNSVTVNSNCVSVCVLVNKIRSCINYH